MSKAILLVCVTTVRLRDCMNSYTNLHHLRLFANFCYFFNGTLNISHNILCSKENKVFLFSKITNCGVIESKRNVCCYQIIITNQTKSQLLCEKTTEYSMHYTILFSSFNSNIMPVSVMSALIHILTVIPVFTPKKTLHIEPMHKHITVKNI